MTKIKVEKTTVDGNRHIRIDIGAMTPEEATKNIKRISEELKRENEEK